MFTKIEQRRATPCILLTGFEPFDNHTVNASWQAVRRLEGLVIGGFRVTARCLPCTFADAYPELASVMDACGPAAVIAVGQANDRQRISLEWTAVNRVHARIPDNKGVQPVDEAIVTDGPDAYVSTLPLEALRQALEQAGLPVEISHSAGTYVCNHVFYSLCHRMRHQHDVPVGFVHVPMLQDPAKPDTSSLSLDSMVEALRVLVGEIGQWLATADDSADPR